MKTKAFIITLLSIVLIMVFVLQQCVYDDDVSYTPKPRSFEIERCEDDRQRAGRTYDVHALINRGLSTYGEKMDELCGPIIVEHVCPDNREGAGYEYTFELRHLSVFETVANEQQHCGSTYEDIRNGISQPTPECFRHWEEITNVLCSTYDITTKTTAEVERDIANSTLPEIEILEDDWTN